MQSAIRNSSLSLSLSSSSSLSLLSSSKDCNFQSCAGRPPFYSDFVLPKCCLSCLCVVEGQCNLLCLSLMCVAVCALIECCTCTQIIFFASDAISSLYHKLLSAPPFPLFLPLVCCRLPLASYSSLCVSMKQGWRRPTPGCRVGRHRLTTLTRSGGECFDCRRQGKGMMR